MPTMISLTRVITESKVTAGCRAEGKPISATV